VLALLPLACKSNAAAAAAAASPAAAAPAANGLQMLLLLPAAAAAVAMLTCEECAAGDAHFLPQQLQHSQVPALSGQV
jgi:hypothetical protein